MNKRVLGATSAGCKRRIGNPSNLWIDFVSFDGTQGKFDHARLDVWSGLIAFKKVPDPIETR